ncbi:MAG: NusG domain II-containing protein [Lachnospiraceae bacterium]|nr:NusG domain II-containing protein [Lachnospiraceae bacterium]
MRRQFGKKDVVFIGSLLLLCAIVLLLFRVAFRSEGTKIVITRDGELYGTYSLSESRTISIRDKSGHVTNTLVIKDGKADMIHADCPDKICVHQKAVSAENETIVCLPNKIVVTVTNSNEEGMDGFAQ